MMNLLILDIERKELLLLHFIKNFEADASLDAILNSKLSLAIKNGIEVDYKAICPEKLSVSDIDLCANAKMTPREHPALAEGGLKWLDAVPGTNVGSEQ